MENQEENIKTEKKKSKKVGRPLKLPKEVDFPKINIHDAVNYITKIVENSGGDIISYGEISNYLRRKGGNLSRIVKGMKAYGLIEKTDLLKEWKITELGRLIGENKNPKDIFKAFTNPQIFIKIWNQYGGERPSSEALRNYVEKREGVKGLQAYKLTNYFLESYDKLTYKPGYTNTSQDDIELKEKGEMVKSSKFDKNLFEMGIKIGRLFPAEKEEDLLKTIKALSKDTKEAGLKELSAIFDTLSLLFEDKKDDEIKEGLLKFKDKILSNLK